MISIQYLPYQEITFLHYEKIVNLGQAEMPVHLLKFESWNVKAHA